MPDAQKAHPIRQPTCEEMQTDQPNLYFIRTDSTRLSSGSLNRYFLVPSSLEIWISTGSGTVMYASFESFSLSAFERSVICEKSVARLW